MNSLALNLILEVKKMNHDKEKLAEKVLIFLYSLSASKFVNVNTFKRYIYLYYLTESFLNGESDNICINIDKGTVNILNFDSVIEDFSIREFIRINENNIIINAKLTDYVSTILENEEGAFFELYKKINPFVNLLKSYNDQFVFTIFFSEPTFKEASQRGLTELNSNNSRLSSLLETFKKKLKNSNIDEYDILTYWMDFILKNYYTDEVTTENAEK